MYADLNTAVLDGVHCMEALVQARVAFTAASTSTAATTTAASAAAGADVVSLSMLTSALTSAACSVRCRRLDECCPRLCEELAAQCCTNGSNNGQFEAKFRSLNIHSLPKVCMHTVTHSSIFWDAVTLGVHYVSSLRLCTTDILLQWLIMTPFAMHACVYYC
jgi:hypothetical protein